MLTGFPFQKSSLKVRIILGFGWLRGWLQGASGLQGAERADGLKALGLGLRAADAARAEGQSERKMERWRDAEMERCRDAETERWRDGETERWRDAEMQRWRDGDYAYESYGYGSRDATQLQTQMQMRK